MKTFAEYLTESKHTYDYRIKIAGDMPEGFMPAFKDKLKQFDVVSMSDVKKTPVQKQLKDFPQCNNESMTFFDVTFNYPATPPQITQIAELLKLNPNNILMQDKKYADSMDEERAKQERFYVAQLKLAIEFDLPVILHVRRSQDVLLKYLRRHPVRGGLAHAFNGSVQQAQQFIDAGFALGFGGAMTYARALQIRRLACALPLESIVLETDAPDIAPAWLTETRRNEPAEVRRIAYALAELRGISYEEVLSKTAEAARSACPTLDLALRS